MLGAAGQVFAASGTVPFGRILLGTFFCGRTLRLKDKNLPWPHPPLQDTLFRGRFSLNVPARMIEYRWVSKSV